MGPTTGSADLDAIARSIAIELFMCESGVRMVAQLMVASTHDSHDKPAFLPSLSAIFNTLFDPETRAELTLFAHHPVGDGTDAGGECQWHFLNRWRSGAMVTPHMLVKDFPAPRLLEQLGHLCKREADPDGGVVFRKHIGPTLHAQLQCTDFVGDPLLQHFFDPEYLAVHVVYYLFGTMTPHADIGHLFPDRSVPVAEVAQDIARHLAEHPHASQRPRMLALARLLQQHQYSRPALVAALEQELVLVMAGEKRLVRKALVLLTQQGKDLL